MDLKELNLLYAAMGAGVIALIFAFWKTAWINKQDPGTDKMKEIGAAIREGAMANTRFWRYSPFPWRCS